MGSLIFKPKDEGEAKKIVDFWNHYCSHIASYRGDSDVYIIEYNERKYDIVRYDALCIDDKYPTGSIKDRIFEYIPEFIDFPQVIRNTMIERSESNSPIPFIINTSSDQSSGGFRWSDTEEGHDFWNEVIRHENFDLFYKHFNLEKDESRLCNKETPFGGDSKRNGSSIRSRFNKARVTVKSLGYKEVIGRG